MGNTQQIIVEVKLRDTKVAKVIGNTGGAYYSMTGVREIIEEGKPLIIYTDEKVCAFTIIQDWNKVANITLRWADQTQLMYNINIV